MSKLIDTFRGWIGKPQETCAQDLTTHEVNEPIKNQTSSSTSLAEVFGVGAFSGKMAVNERTAMCVSAVFSCVSLIGGAIGGLPLPVFEKTNQVAAQVDHPVSKLLNLEPSPRCSAPVFWEYLVLSLLFQGDAFAEIVRKSPYSPEIKAFEPWHPSNVSVTVKDKRLKYTLTDPETGLVRVIDQDDMLHTPGIGFNGRRGMSPLSHALRSAVGIASASSEHTESFFTNGARPDFVLKMEGTPTTEQIALMREQWDNVHGGVAKKWKPAILTGGLDLKELTMTSDDAQLIANRQFSVEDIARIFGVPPFMIGHTEKTTSWGSGVEGMSINFVKYTLMRHLKKFEKEINRKIFRDSSYFVEFNTAGLERGDLKSRYDAHRVAIGRAGEPGFITVNEVRRIENYAPIEGGDVLFRGDNVQNTQAAG